MSISLQTAITYIGIQNGTQCVCSPNFSFEKPSVGCYIPCNKDSLELCDVMKDVEVYEVPNASTVIPSKEDYYVSNCKLDVAFLVDVSAALTLEKWTYLKELLESFIEKQKNGLINAQIGIMQFAENVTILRHLDQAMNQSVKSGTDSMSKPGGLPNIHKALKVLHSEMFSARNGDRPGKLLFCQNELDNKSFCYRGS